MLGIDWLKIVIHFVVFSVLAVGLYLLLYKPILRFIRTRQENIQKGIDDGKAMQEEGQALKDEYDRKLADVEAERDRVLAQANAEGEQIVTDARAKVQEECAAIKEGALRRAQADQEAAKAELRQDAGKVAVDLAGAILGREISAEENERIIIECLDAWSDHD